MSSEEILALRLLEVLQSFSKPHRLPCPIPNLRPSELMMLFHIAREAGESDTGLKISDISKNLLVSSPTVTQIVNNLEKQGLVARRIDQNDRRAVRINVSEAGKKIVQSTQQDFLHKSIGLVKYLGEDKIKFLIDIMPQVSSYFSQADEQF